VVASHLLGKDNTEADLESTHFQELTDVKLSDTRTRLFLKPSQTSWGAAASCEIDLFALRVNAQLNKFCFQET